VRAPGRHAVAAGGGPPIPRAASRAALWRPAGLERDGVGLRRLAGDEHPLVRLIAASALARPESRGAHQTSPRASRSSTTAT
jgi:hypothetical protein